MSQAIAFSAAALNHVAASTNVQINDGQLLAMAKVISGIVLKVAVVAGAALEAVVRIALLVAASPLWLTNPDQFSEWTHQTWSAASTIMEALKAITLTSAESTSEPIDPTGKSWSESLNYMVDKVMYAARTVATEASNHPYMTAGILLAALCFITTHYYYPDALTSSGAADTSADSIPPTGSSDADNFTHSDCDNSSKVTDTLTHSKFNINSSDSNNFTNSNSSSTINPVFENYTTNQGKGNNNTNKTIHPNITISNTEESWLPNSVLPCVIGGSIIISLVLKKALECCKTVNKKKQENSETDNNTRIATKKLTEGPSILKLVRTCSVEVTSKCRILQIQDAAYLEQMAQYLYQADIEWRSNNLPINYPEICQEFSRQVPEKYQKDLTLPLSTDDIIDFRNVLFDSGYHIPSITARWKQTVAKRSSVKAVAFDPPNENPSLLDKIKALDPTIIAGCPIARIEDNVFLQTTADYLYKNDMDSKQCNSPIDYATIRMAFYTALPWLYKSKKEFNTSFSKEAISAFREILFIVGLKSDAETEQWKNRVAQRSSFEDIPLPPPAQCKPPLKATNLLLLGKIPEGTVD